MRAPHRGDLVVVGNSEFEFVRGVRTEKSSVTNAYTRQPNASAANTATACRQREAQRASTPGRRARRRAAASAPSISASANARISAKWPSLAESCDRLSCIPFEFGRHVVLVVLRQHLVGVEHAVAAELPGARARLYPRGTGPAGCRVYITVKSEPCRSVTTKRTSRLSGARCTLPSFTMPPARMRGPTGALPDTTSTGGIEQVDVFVQRAHHERHRDGRRRPAGTRPR